jgi:hypothetical protein
MSSAEHSEGEAMAATSAAAAQPLFPWPQFFRHVYAAKFLCGELKPGKAAGPEGPVEPGSYSTAINVHNPHGFRVGLRKKAILLYDARHPEQAVERPTPPVRRECPVLKELGPDWGLEIDCRDIREVLLADASGKPGPPAPTFIKGWVVIETLSDVPLDVVAVYTVAPLGTNRAQPVSIATDRVPGRRVFLPGF